MRARFSCAVVIATACVFLQVDQAHSSFFSMLQGDHGLDGKQQVFDQQNDQHLQQQPFDQQNDQPHQQHLQQQPFVQSPGREASQPQAQPFGGAAAMFTSMFNHGAGNGAGESKPEIHPQHQGRHHHHHHHHHQGFFGGAGDEAQGQGHSFGGGSPWSMLSHFGNLKGLSGFSGFPDLSHFGGFSLQNLQPLKQKFSAKIKAFMPTIQRYQHSLGEMSVNLGAFAHLNRSHSVKAFYSKCGTSVRHCVWEQKRKILTKRSKVYLPDTEVDDSPIETEQSCYSTNHICVGNTETCVSKHNCDAAMQITELVNENSGASSILRVSYINNCHMESQSITDNSRMPQMFFGIGFATYDEAGENLVCRGVKASDFKLVFLWQNSSDSETNSGSGICQTPPEHDIRSVKLFDFELMNEAKTWPSICKTLAGKEGGFKLKSFVEKHVPTSHFTSFFKPPFTFADHFEPTISSNGMAVTGVIHELTR